MHRLALFALALLVAPACSLTENDPETAGPARHTLAIDGESTVVSPWSETVSGRALFAPTTFLASDGTAYPRLSLQLQDARTARYVLLSVDTYDAAIPTLGTYPVTTDERGVEGAFYLSLAHVQVAPAFTEFFEAEVGTVTIEVASGARLAGRLDVTMRTAGYTAPGGHAVRVTGTFDARPGH